MSNIFFEFPVLVEQDDKTYIVTPLLFPSIKTQSSRYGNALNLLQRKVSKILRQVDMDKKGMESLLWYKFCPDFVFAVEHFSFRTGMHLVDGKFAVVYFSVNDHKYVCFPKLDHQIFRLADNIRGQQATLQFLTEKLVRFFKRERKENEEKFSPQAYYAKKHCTTTRLSFSLECRAGEFSFEKNKHDFFSFFTGDLTFDGAQELEKVAEDIAHSDQAQPLTFFRQREQQWLMRALFGAQAQAIALIGEQGIGKSNLVSQVYSQQRSKYAGGNNPKCQRVWRLDPLRVVSGMSIVGQWERRFEAILCRIRDRIRKNTKSRESDILLVENPVALMRIGKTRQTALTLAHLLIPYIARREFSVVLCATPQEWQKVQELNRSFADLFQVLRLTPLKPEQNDYIVHRRRAELEQQFACEFDTGAYTTVAKCERQLRGVKALPGSMIDLLQNIAITSQHCRIDDVRVYRSLQENFHINSRILDHNSTLSYAEVEEYFRTNLIGQDQAIGVLVNTILSIKARLCSNKRPQNSMLFIGPTGVGKTEAAKLLANYLYSKDDALVRIDMNEYVDIGAVDRLIGSDYHPSGILTERVRYQKSCVLLLDEIEKAHPYVHDLLLQLLDDGRLTDAAGNTTDFSQCVVIMTSNVGAKEASNQFGFTQNKSELGATYLKSVEQFFRPELVNRINNIVVFEALKKHDMIQLARLHLTKLLMRDGFVRRSTILNVDAQCLERIADLGYDPQLGARALKRNLERTITQSTAVQLAEIDSNEPIILNMWWQDEKINADVVKLKYADSLADSIPRCLSFSLNQYKLLLQTIQGLEQRLNDLEPQMLGQQEVQYMRWRLMDAVRNLSEPLQSFIFEQEEKKPTQNLKVQRSFKSTPSKVFDAVRKPRINFSALHSQHDVCAHLDEMYQKAESYFVKEKGNDFDLWSQAARGMLAVQSFCQQGIDEGYLLIQSLVAHKGEDGVALIGKIYVQLLEEFCHHEVLQSGDDFMLLKARGPALHELFRSEEGVHLSYETGNIQVPIVVRYIPSEDIDGDMHRINHHERRCRTEDGRTDIVRVYALDKQSPKSGNISDVRTGLMIDAKPGEHWWALFSYLYTQVLPQEGSE